jgi:hypothetical protein
MDFSVETEKAIQLKDRKIAGIVAFTAFSLLLTLLCFIGYRISNPPLSKPAAYEEMAFIPLDPQILEQVRQGSQSGTPAKTKKTETTPLQTEQVLTTASSSSHVTSGNSNITNTSVPNNNPSGAKHVSDNPFGTGGINDGKFRGSNPLGTHDDQDEIPKSPENTARFLITAPNTNDIQSDENCKVVLSVTVAPDGAIVGNPTFVKNGSTTNDMVLIEQLIKIVKAQAKYNKVNTTKNTKVALVIRITAS